MLWMEKNFLKFRGLADIVHRGKNFQTESSTDTIGDDILLINITERMHEVMCEVKMI
jgi:hypothetical protein